MRPSPPPSPSLAARPVWNPYLAGVGLGLTLLLSFVVLGAGLGASGAIARGAAEVAHAVAPAAVEENTYLGGWFEDGPATEHYLVFMALGVLLGGGLSAFAARRTRATVERGPRLSVRGRLGFALAGGLLAGFAARLAGGCTSGQALTGGALLADGSWVFMLTTFAGAFAAAPLLRRAWR